MDRIVEAYKHVLKCMSYKPSDVNMSMWIKRFMWSACFVAFFYAYYIHSFNGIAMLMAMTGIWSLNNVLTRKRIIFYLDLACVTVSLCIVDTIFLSGELSFLGPFMSLLVALISIFILGLFWGNILGLFNCIFLIFSLKIESFTWIRDIYSDTFCEHFPYIMVAFFASAIFLQYGITGHVLSKRDYREQLEQKIDEGKQERRKISINMLVAMYKALCTKSPEVGKHCERTAQLSQLIARKVGLTGRDYRRSYYAGLLHDIGKIGSVNAFYWYKKRMSKKYREEYMRHIDIGYQIVEPLGLQEISDATLYHHENFDGSGHKGISGEDIPLMARIVAVANAIAHFESDKKDFEEIIILLTAMSGNRMDPQVVECANDVLRHLKKEKEEEAVFGKVE